VIVRYDGRTWCGAVADLREHAPTSRAVAAAIRGDDAPCRVHCPVPGPLFDHVGHVHPEMGLRLRTALAVAARSRGLTAPQASEIERLRAERDRITLDDGHQHRSDAPDTDPTELRERVATLRGRVQALEANGEDASDARAELRAAAATLSEGQTARIAAEEYRTQTRTDRDRRERRMRLDDRIANLERDARSALVEQIREPYERAVFALDSTVEPFDAPPLVAALAIGRIGRPRGPVVLATDRFPSPAAAADWIGGPVICCDE